MALTPWWGLLELLLRECRVSSTTRDQVYGIQRTLPLNYVERPGVDGALRDNLTRKKHVVIHGSSKQGKTCLRKHCLEESEYIMVQCSNKWNLSELHAAVLKRAGFEVTQSTKRTASGKNLVKASIGAKWLGLGSDVEGSAERAQAEETVSTGLELDMEDVNDVISALRQVDFDRFIVLEDFHYLSPEVQRDFAVALKSFHEASDLCFVIVGVWLEENRLIVYNGDLTGRVVAVNADSWSLEELHQVVESGGELLNVRFDPTFVSDLAVRSQGSVYIVQEVCRQLLEHESIEEKCAETRVVGVDADVDVLVKLVVDQQSARYRSFIINFSEGFQQTRLEMYRYILLPVLKGDSESLARGIRLADVRSALKEGHPEGKTLNYGNITQALKSAADLQIKKDIKPIILDYDETNLRLDVVDRGFLIWLDHQDTAALLELAGLEG